MLKPKFTHAVAWLHRGSPAAIAEYVAVQEQTNAKGTTDAREQSGGVRSVAARESVAWSRDFAGSEHPETARLRIQKDYVETITALKRESIDQTHGYLLTLMEKAKEELGHSRSSSNEQRRATLQQHIDELIAYVAGHGINPKLPNKYGDSKGAPLAGYYVSEEIPSFLGELKFMIDLWYEKGLNKVHDEVAVLIGMGRATAAARQVPANSQPGTPALRANAL